MYIRCFNTKICFQKNNSCKLASEIVHILVKHRKKQLTRKIHSQHLIRKSVKQSVASVQGSFPRTEALPTVYSADEMPARLGCLYREIGQEN